MLYWLPAKSGPPTIARTAPVVGSIETSDATQSSPEGLDGLSLSVASWAAAWAWGSNVV